jgi:FKBP-type peptidyl-prolyl cis-trans isomerase
MKNRIKILGVTGLFIIVLSACNKTGTWEKQERSQIDAYIKALGDTAYVLKPSGLYYIELQAGTGRTPVAKDTASFRYVGMFLDRVVFDQNLALANPYSAVIGNFEVIAGLDEGLRYMKEGGKARFLTPSSLAYGQGGWWGAIPGYTPLIWEVTLVKVSPGPVK